MDLTQQTHGRLLAAFSFNNRYPSPPLLPPSIRSVISVCLFVSFFSQCVCFGLTFSFPSSSFPAFYTHTHTSMFWNRFQTPRTWFFSSFSCFRSLFSSPLAAWLSHPHSIPSSPALPPPLFISPSLHRLVQSAAADSQLKHSVCCQRDGGPRKSDLFIHALFPAIQIMSVKNIILCQPNSMNFSNAFRLTKRTSCYALQSRWCVPKATADETHSSDCAYVTAALVKRRKQPLITSSGAMNWITESFLVMM